MVRGHQCGPSQGISGDDVSDSDRNHRFGLDFSDTTLWVAVTVASVSTVMFVTTYQASNAGRCDVSLSASEASAFLQRYMTSMQTTSWQTYFTAKSGTLFNTNTASGAADSGAAE